MSDLMMIFQNKLPIEEDGLNRIFQLLWPKVANLLEKTIKEEVK